MKDLKSTSVPEATSKGVRLRVTMMGLVFMLFLITVWGRAFELQVLQRGKLKGLAEDQYVRQIQIPGRRGDIFDRRGVSLAQSVEVDSIWVDPSMLSNLGQSSKILARILHLNSSDVFDRLSKARRFAWVKRQARSDEVEEVRKLSFPGIGFTKEPKRFYPQRELAAHVIGVVGTDGKGLEGIELAFNDELTGETSKLNGFRDAKGRKLLTQGGLLPSERQGAAMVLTIDRQLQYITERALAKAVISAKAAAGMAVVMDPATGEILAIANEPHFNPNLAQDASKGYLRNRAALDAFEPGSTIKIFTVAGALEDKLVKPYDVFFCENGAWEVGRHVVHDTHPSGWLTTARTLQVSSNIGAAKIGQKLGRQRLVDYFAKFGFGGKTGLALPGEGRGAVPFPKSDISLATESFGQGMSATAVQLATGYAAVANGGTLMRPYLVSKVIDTDGLVLLENRPTEVRRVISQKTARELITMMEGVAEKEGTAPKARMENYRVAGKTGTAQKVDPVAKGYSDKRIASFIGMVPAELPRVVIAVIIDEPKTDIYGGLVAAPAFKEIAEVAMPYLGVHSSQELKEPPVVAAEKAVTKNEVIAEVTEKLGSGWVMVPRVAGQVGREAVAHLLALSLEPRLSGSGRVVSQIPPAGTRVEKGTQVVVEMAVRQ